ncbi:MAG: hypothetical protein JO053_10500 [Acidobacteria bacterium]|nr:hypothetical protein [Acidobacteriota bacterium]
MKANRRPFWLPASNYYVLAIAITAAFFFLLWGILHDADVELPWVTAGISASVFLAGAVVLRVILMHRARVLSQQPTLGSEPIERRSSRRERVADTGKLTLELNEAILREIRQKSDAANVLGALAAAHLEVAELCRRYIARNDNELKSVKASSPRLAPLLKGRSAAAKLHKAHLLRWAEIESQALTADARSRSAPGERMKAAEDALGVVERALEAYPGEAALLDSREILVELVLQVKVANLVEQAERTHFEGDNGQAIILYREALFELGRDNIVTETRGRAAERITTAIERIRSISNE